jgi:hypothetical protein
MCEGHDYWSFACSPFVLDNLMRGQRPGPSLPDYVHFMRHAFDDYNETCELIDGFAAIHSHNLGMRMLCGICSNGPFGQSKQCVISAFDKTTFCQPTR